LAHVEFYEGSSLNPRFINALDELKQAHSEERDRLIDLERAWTCPGKVESTY